MKKIFSTIVALAVAAFTFTSCEDVPMPYDMPGSQPLGPVATVISPSGDGSEAHPYNVAAVVAYVKELGAGVESPTAVYVKGKILSISTTQDAITSFGNHTFDMVDEGNTTTKFKAFQVYGPGNKKFTSLDAVKVGDEVVVYGKVTNYQGNTPETVGKGAAYVVSINSGSAPSDQTPTPGETVTTIAAAQAAPAGTTVNIEKATVVATAYAGAVLNDGTANLYYYNTAHGLSVGDVVTASGELSTYGGFNQLGNTAKVEKKGTESVSYPTAEVLNGAAVDAWLASPSIKYVKTEGTLTISGNYYNVAVDGAKGVVSLLATDAMKAGLTSGSKVTITGYAMYSTSSGKYLNIVATEVKSDGVNPNPNPDPNPGPGTGVVDGNSITVEASSLGVASGTEVGTKTLSDGTKLEFDGGGNTNAPKYYSTGTNVRMYPKNSVKITASKKIASVVLNCDENSGTIYNASGDIAATPGSVNTNEKVVTVSGINGNTVTISNTSTTTGAPSQLRIVSFVITYAE